MRIIGRNILNKFAQKHPNDRSALNRWYNLMRQETFTSFADLLKIFPYANQVKVRKSRFNKLLETRTSQPAVLPLYAESDYHWLVGALDKLIAFVRRDENHSVPELTENDYKLYGNKEQFWCVP